MPYYDRFEDYYRKVGISLDTFPDMEGDSFFNWIDCLRLAGVRTVVFYSSAHVSEPLRLTHNPTGADAFFFPTPWIHRKLQGARDRLWPALRVPLSVESYVATPLGLLAREIRRQGCGAILCQEYEYPRFDVGVLLGRLLRLPVFATYAGANRPRTAIELPFRHIALKACAGLIIGSRAEIDRVRERYKVPTAKVGHIPNPTDFATWDPVDRRKARAELGIPADATVVAWHGHVWVQRKGLDVLLEAWKKVCNMRPDAKLLLLLIGAGGDEGKLRRLLSSASAESVLWIDRHVNDRPTLWRYLSSADVYTMPSRHEGFAVAPLEAMACGLPIVASDVSGIRDLLEAGEASGGLIVPPGDASSLASALGRMVDDPAWRRDMGRRARRRVQERFSLQVVGRELREFMSSRGAFSGAR